MHNPNQNPLLRSLKIELFDTKSVLNTLLNPADHSMRLLVIQFQRLLQTILLFSIKCKTLHCNRTLWKLT